MHGKQSTLLSSALRQSKTISETKAVTCRRKSSRTANATKRKKREAERLRPKKRGFDNLKIMDVEANS